MGVTVGCHKISYNYTKSSIANAAILIQLGVTYY